MAKPLVSDELWAIGEPLLPPESPKPKWGAESGPNPTDRGNAQRAPGSKHHLLVDRQGIPLTVTLSATNMHDSQMPEATVDAVPSITRPRGRPRRRPVTLHADKGYDYPISRLRRRCIVPRIARRADLHRAFLSLGCALICWNDVQARLCQALLAQALFQCRHALQRWPRFQRLADRVHLGSPLFGDVVVPARDVQIGQCQQRQRALERRAAGVGEVERLCQMLLSERRVAVLDCELAEEAMDGDQRQWLARVAGLGERSIDVLVGEIAVAARVVVLRPEQRALGLADDGARPRQPVIVRAEPIVSTREIGCAEGQRRRQALHRGGGWDVHRARG